ncbi:MAG: hypothetical protein E7616_05435 [Ruminococcaceae bacterium]|nr:hypothetical protein [Oscillospiraceae bacterium]
MNLFKKWKNGMALCLLFALLLSSCGGAMPTEPDAPSSSTDVQTPDSENITQPTVKDPTSGEKADPDETRRILDAEMMRYLCMRTSDRSDYLSSDALSDSINASIDCLETAKTVLGTPHYYSAEYGYPMDDTIYVYIAENAQVLEIVFDSRDILKEMNYYSVDNYISHIPQAWGKEAYVHADPMQIHRAVDEEFEKHEYVFESDRTDYPDATTAKSIQVETPMLKVREILGEPHYIQTVKDRLHKDDQLILPFEHHFYILSDGTVLILYTTPHMITFVTLVLNYDLDSFSIYASEMMRV